MSNIIKHFTITTALVLFATSACASPTSEAQEDTKPEPTVTSTQNAVNLLVIPTASLQPIPPSPTFSPTQVTPSPTQSLITRTVSPTTTPSPTPSCTNKAKFIKNLTIGDFTALKPGEHFTKIWQIQNIGTCTWDQNYTLFFIGGDTMDGSQSISLPQVVETGDLVNLYAKLVAPFEAGTYTGNWMLQDTNGNLFGLGETGDQSLTVKIVTMPTPRPTSGCSRCKGVEDD